MPGSIVGNGWEELPPPPPPPPPPPFNTGNFDDEICLVLIRLQQLSSLTSQLEFSYVIDGM